MTLSEELTWRGLIKDKTFRETTWLDKPKAFYLGIDASADSLTVGNLAILMLARRLSDAGWKAVLVMGGGTSLVGDPGGKLEERQLMSREKVESNIAGVRDQVTKLFSGENYTMVDNYDWLNELKYLDILRDVGKHFSMTELMQRDFVSDRMGQAGTGISYAEFSYSIVQGYDYWHLYKNHKVVLQIGGSDQWGNILSGVSLIRKKEAAEAHALSMPLIINKATGVKFGKSEGGAIWLDPAKTTPTKFYQFWINTNDDDMEDYLKVFTLLSKEEVEEVMRQQNQDPAKRVAQMRLAHQATTLVHGEQETQTAEAISHILVFQQAIGNLKEDLLPILREEIPSIKVSKTSSIISALVDSGLASSNTEARRFIANNAVAINGQKVSREEFEPGDFQSGRLLLRRGKAFKDTALIEQ